MKIAQTDVLRSNPGAIKYYAKLWHQLAFVELRPTEYLGQKL